MNDSSDRGGSVSQQTDSLSNIGRQRRGSWLKGLYSSFTESAKPYNVDGVIHGKSEESQPDTGNAILDSDEQALELYGKQRERTKSEPFLINATDFVREGVPNDTNINEGVHLPSSPNESTFVSKQVKRGSFLSTLIGSKFSASVDSPGILSRASEEEENEPVDDITVGADPVAPKRGRSGSLQYFSRLYQGSAQLPPTMEAKNENDPDGIETGELYHFLSSTGRGF